MTDNEINRRLAAIVAADIVAYSRLMSEDELGTLQRLKAIQQELVEPRIREFGGRLVKTTGDGALLEFSSAVDALQCAVVIQNQMTEREKDVPVHQRIVYRIGINLSDVLVDGDDIFGDGVNVAARLESLAEPGGIYISDAVFKNVKGKLDLGFANLGPKQVKNIAEPVLTYSVLLNPEDAGKVLEPPKEIRFNWKPITALFVLIVVVIGGYIGWKSYSDIPSSEVDTPPHLLVLPFEAKDEASRHYAEVASEDLWLAFSRIKELTIVPRARALELKGLDSSASQLKVAEQVSHILEGSIGYKGDDIVVDFLLKKVDTDTQSTLDSDSFIGPKKDFFRQLLALKTHLTAALSIPLTQLEREKLEKIPTANTEAFLSYATAHHLYRNPDWNNYVKALPLYEKALDLDPMFLDAKEGYAEINFQIWRRGWANVRNTLEAKKLSQQLVNQILEIDPANASALSTRILIELYELNRESALTMANGAVFTNSHAPELRYVLGITLLANQQYEKAAPELNKYLARSPRLDTTDTRNLAGNFLRLGMINEATELLEGLEKKKVEGLSIMLFAQAYARAGRLEEAKIHLEQFMQIWPAGNLAWDRTVEFAIFADPQIYKTYEQAMLSIDYPQWPYNFHKDRENDRLDEQDLRRHFGQRSYRLVDAIDQLGMPYEQIMNSDGTLVSRHRWLRNEDNVGQWQIEGDEICVQFPALYVGRRHCNWIYYDSENSTEANRRFMTLDPFGITRYAIEYID